MLCVIMIIIENYCSAHEHERYNSAVLNEILSKNQDCILFCDQKHWENIKGIFDCYEQGYTNLQHVHIRTPKYKITSLVFLHNLFTMLWIRLYLFIFRYNTKLVTILTATSGNIIMTRLFFHNFRTLLHMHAIASTLNKNVKIYNRIFHFKKYIKYCGDNIKLGCLSTWIYNSLSSQYGCEKFCNIGMAYWQSRAKISVKPVEKPKVRVGFIGVATKEKGGDILDGLFSGQDNLSVEFIHFSAHALEGLENHLWPDVSHGGFFQFMEYVDLIIMPYDKDFYKYVVPATLFDCISFKKPFLISPLKCWEDVPEELRNAEHLFILEDKNKFFQYLMNVQTTLLPTIEKQRAYYEAM